MFDEAAELCSDVVCVPCDECSPCAADGTLVPDLEADITVEGAIADVDDAWRSAFEVGMAEALGGIDSSRVEVTSVMGASIAAGFRIKGAVDTAAEISPAALADTFSTQDVSFGSFVSKSVILVTDILETAAACMDGATFNILRECKDLLFQFAEMVPHVVRAIEGGVMDSDKEEDKAQVKQWKEFYCSSTCAVTLEPKWLACSRGSYMPGLIASTLSLPAFVSDHLCGMKDKEAAALLPEWLLTLMSVVSTISTILWCWRSYKNRADNDGWLIDLVLEVSTAIASAVTVLWCVYTYMQWAGQWGEAIWWLQPLFIIGTIVAIVCCKRTQKKKKKEKEEKHQSSDEVVVFENPMEEMEEKKTEKKEEKKKEKEEEKKKKEEMEEEKEEKENASDDVEKGKKKTGGKGKKK